MKRFKTPRAFLYHAHGFAISGMITKPFQDFIPTQAMATLPTTGGLAEATNEDYRYKDIVSFKSAETVITGISPKDNVYETDMKVTIEGLNIRDRFTADKSGHSYPLHTHPRRLRQRKQGSLGDHPGR